MVNAIVGAELRCARAVVKLAVSLVWFVSIRFARESAIPPEVNVIFARLVLSDKVFSSATVAFPELIVKVIGSLVSVLVIPVN